MRARVVSGRFRTCRADIPQDLARYPLSGKISIEFPLKFGPSICSFSWRTIIAVPGARVLVGISHVIPSTVLGRPVHIVSWRRNRDRRRHYLLAGGLLGLISMGWTEVRGSVSDQTNRDSLMIGLPGTAHLIIGAALVGLIVHVASARRRNQGTPGGAGP